MDEDRPASVWLPGFDVETQNGESGASLTYIVSALPTNGLLNRPAGPASFHGIASFDGDDFSVTGPRSTTVSAEADPVWSSARLEGGGPSFTLVGQANTAYQIEASANLIDWQPLQTTTTSAIGASVFQPDDPTQGPHRFFRARRLP